MSTSQIPVGHPAAQNTTNSLRTEALRAGLLRLTDCGLLALVVLAPLFMGGRHPVGRFVFVTLIAFTAIVWAIRSCVAVKDHFRWSGAEWLLGLALLLVGFQLLPLPTETVLQLAPSVAELLPLLTTDADSPAGLAPWTRLSLTPQSTAAGMVMLIAYVVLFVVVVQRIQTMEDIRRLLTWLAIAVVVMGTLGLAQFLFSNGKFFWIYQHPSRSTGFPAKGMFANQNHFAHFLALGLGPLLWLIWRSGSDSVRGRSRTTSHFRSAHANPWHQYRQPALALGIGVVTFAGLLSFSRGGVIVLFLAALTCVTVYWYRSLVGKRSLAGMAVVGGFVAIALVVYGYQPLIAEMETLRADSFRQLGESSYRLALWDADLAASQDFPLFGTGVGSHREVYPAYFSNPTDVEFTHAESGYLQILLEAGVVGIVLLFCGLLLAAAWVVRALRAGSPNVAGCAGAVFAGLLISAVHSVVDFVWYIPACMTLTVILLACACRLSHFTRDADSSRTTALPQLVRISCCGALLLVTAGMIRISLPGALAGPHWDRYLSQALHQDTSLATTPEQQQQRLQSADAMIEHLRDVLRNDPQHSRAHLRIAQIYLRMFELAQKSSANQMPLAHIRDAANASQFPSRQALERWLEAAVGPHFHYLDDALNHCHQTLRLCPLQGDGYALLAELAFLEGRAEEATQAFVAQALLLRPHDGYVLLAAGREAALQGNPQETINYWKAAFHQESGVQAKIIELLAAQVPAQFFLDEFSPDVDGLYGLYRKYHSLGLVEEATVIYSPLVASIVKQAQQETGDAAASRWWQAHTILVSEGDFEQATLFGGNALRASPNSFAMRRGFAEYLVKQQQYDEAIEHIQWCLRRAPGDRGLLDSLRMADDRQLDSVPISRAPAPPARGGSTR